MVSWGGDSTAPRKRKPVPSAVDETSAITYLTEERIPNGSAQFDDLHAVVERQAVSICKNKLIIIYS